MTVVSVVRKSVSPTRSQRWCSEANWHAPKAGSNPKYSELRACTPRVHVHAASVSVTPVLAPISRHDNRVDDEHRCVGHCVRGFELPDLHLVFDVCARQAGCGEVSKNSQRLYY